ncbi:L,D-transpeptidase family protein [Pseudomonas knackmussii]|uniref:L,D-transpeptidase family protein n=1 Tax=Pseudomonas knackmussii TaxID=65741 RepID=UPI003BD23FC5
MQLRSVLKIGLTLLGLVIFLFIYTLLSKRLLPGEAPPMQPVQDQAVSILVHKAERKMWLIGTNGPLREYPISLGANPQGHKQKEGDERTPEGHYVIDWRNDHSAAHLSLHISYPNQGDLQLAQQLGVKPGGNIMIHGLTNGWGALGNLHRLYDWTNGCIAVSNSEMEEIWSLVPNGTPIDIQP